MCQNVGFVGLETMGSPMATNLAKAGGTITVGNPAFRNAPIAEVPRALTEDVDAAVQMAHKAFQTSARFSKLE